MDLNKAMIIGRLTRDPEMRSTPSGANVVSFSVATNRAYTDKDGQKREEVEYHNVVAWRKLADIIHQYVRKGGKIYIEGRLQTRSWDDQSGKKNYRTEIVADNMIMLDNKRSNDNAPPPEQEMPNEPEIPTISYDTPANPPSKDEEVHVEDIPF